MASSNQQNVKSEQLMLFIPLHGAYFSY